MTSVVRKKRFPFAINRNDEGDYFISPFNCFSWLFLKNFLPDRFLEYWPIAKVHCPFRFRFIFTYKNINNNNTQFKGKVKKALGSYKAPLLM